MSTTASERPEPAWDVARLYPNQGAWDEEDYLMLPGNHLVEFDDGRVEVLPMPTTLHQLIVMYLYRALFGFASPADLGTVLTAPLRVRLRPGKFREPDVIFMLAKHAHRVQERWWDGADLVMEVVSKDADDRNRDLVTKRAEYAQAGIPEYWIVDPEEATITVLTLARGKYKVAGVYGDAEKAKSVLLAGFEVEVKSALAGK